MCRVTTSGFEIPLPPLDVHVAEIGQQVIDGARMVVDNYSPHIAVDPEWPLTLDALQITWQIPLPFYR